MEMKIITIGKLPTKRHDKGRIFSIEGLCETITTQAGKGHQPIIMEVKRYEQDNRSGKL